MSRKELYISHGILIMVILVLVLRWGNGVVPLGQVVRANSSDYTFTNPILDYEDANMAHVSIFSESVEDKVAELKGKYGLDFASVYFRDLNNGQWIGVNEKESLASASLIKLPILISVLHEEEKDPMLAAKKVTIIPADGEVDLTQNIKPEHQVAPGETYSVEELSQQMITESDNIATQALLRAVPENREEIYRSVGVKFQEEGNEVMVSVKNYGGFFRVLYNATYLSRENSEKALNILSHVKFDKGLVAGVPKGVAVAHKFGERGITINGLEGSRQLHDCGIIYYPKNPYILCIMTRGTDFIKQEAFIADVSSYFYNEVKKSLSSSTGKSPF